MRKIGATLIASIIFGVIIYGAGIAEATNTQELQVERFQGSYIIGSENNASFLAPMPVVYVVLPVETSAYHGNILLMPRLVCTD
jgi:hypothetical protein